MVKLAQNNNVGAVIGGAIAFGSMISDSRLSRPTKTTSRGSAPWHQGSRRSQ
jgi:hypothetical protein